MSPITLAAFSERIGSRVPRGAGVGAAEQRISEMNGHFITHREDDFGGEHRTLRAERLREGG